MGSSLPKSSKYGLFGINLPLRTTTLTDFLNRKSGVRRDSQVHTLMPNVTVMAVKMWAYIPQIVKNCNFWYKVAPKGKFWKYIEKVEYRCTTTNLPICNGTITVLKITLLHSISVITNFIIPKRDKKRYRQTKNITLFRLQPACHQRSPPYLAQ